MVNLKSVQRRFEIMFTIIDGGSGQFRAVIAETDQVNQPSYIFVPPRHVLRTPSPSPLQPGMVIRSPYGSVFIVGYNGPSENHEGRLWNSFRLFEPTGQYDWVRRTKVLDPVTRQERESVPQNMGKIWVAIEPMDREQTDREIRTSFEQARFITGALIQSDDLINDRPVTKVDRQLGLAVGVLT